MSTEKLDPYALLGIKPTASPDEIKRAFRQRALSIHPDRNRGGTASAEEFARLTEAYNLLIDPRRRREFDGSFRTWWRQFIATWRAQEKAAAFKQAAAQTRGRGAGQVEPRPSRPNAADDAQPIVATEAPLTPTTQSRAEKSPSPSQPRASDPAGVSRAKSVAPPPTVEPPVAPKAPAASPVAKAAPPPPVPESPVGSPKVAQPAAVSPASMPLRPAEGAEDRLEPSEAVIEFTVPFLTAAEGGRHLAVVDLEVSCPECLGRGCEADSERRDCPDCHGRGSFEGQTCPRCAGRGYLVDVACRNCGGAGSVGVRRELPCEIPPLMRSGHRFIFTGVDGVPSNRRLVLLARIAAHAVFERRGADLLSQETVNLAQAVYGDRIVVRTLSGNAEVDLPPMTLPGSVLRLEGFGFPIPPQEVVAAKASEASGDATQRGHHYIALQVDLPKLGNKSTEQRFYTMAKAAGLLDAMRRPPEDPRPSRGKKEK